MNKGEVVKESGYYGWAMHGEEVCLYRCGWPGDSYEDACRYAYTSGIGTPTWWEAGQIVA